MLNAALNSIATLALAGPWGDSGPWDSEWWWVWRISMFLFWIGLIVLAVWWVRRTSFRREISGLEQARNILAERYARGEIDADEYRERFGQLQELDD